MGYYTRVTGEISIEPPLRWCEFKDSPFNPTVLDVWDGTKNVKLRVVEDREDTDDGTLLRKTADAIVPGTDDSAKFYNLIDHAQETIDAFPGHTFIGRFDCEGEEAGDLWRVVVRDGVAMKDTPQITWPDDA